MMPPPIWSESKIGEDEGAAGAPRKHVESLILFASGKVADSGATRLT